MLTDLTYMKKSEWRRARLSASSSSALFFRSRNSACLYTQTFTADVGKNRKAESRTEFGDKPAALAYEHHIYPSALASMARHRDRILRLREVCTWQTLKVDQPINTKWSRGTAGGVTRARWNFCCEREGLKVKSASDRGRHSDAISTRLMVKCSQG